MNVATTTYQLNDFQIVSGRQTKASLYYTQKKYKEVDLSKKTVANHTKIFNNLELANVKEQALIKAFESLKKLKKFGIKI